MSANMQFVGDRAVSGLGFEELVQQFAEGVKADEAENSIWWAEERILWIRRVRELFDRMDGWLRPLIAAGTVKSVRGQQELTERQLGRYIIESLELQVASKRLRFEPMGSSFLFVSGRIHVEGPNGSVLLLLLKADGTLPDCPESGETDWFIAHPAINVTARKSIRASSPWMTPPNAENRVLTEGHFQQLFMDLLGILY